jgi:outer membrane receptor for monomeric catechols
MPARMSRTIIIVLLTVGLCDAAFAADRARPRHRLPADRDRHADPGVPYKADRLSSQRQPILDTPGQTTVLTREVLDDMNATTLRDALRSTAGVTIGR